MPPMHPRCRSSIMPVIDSIVIKPAENGNTNNKPKKEPKKANKKPKIYKKYTLESSKEIPKVNNFLKNITSKESKAITKYTKSEWCSDINTYLRGKKKSFSQESWEALKKSCEPVIKTISGALKKGIAHDDIMVYRGTSASIFKGLGIFDDYDINDIRRRKMSAKELDTMTKGLIIQDKGFMSTTVASDSNTSTGQFNSGIVLEIKIDKGSTGGGYIAPISDYYDEREWLLDKDTRLQIEKVTFDDKNYCYNIQCKYINPSDLED